MLTVKQALALKWTDTLVVTRTGEKWDVVGVTPNKSPSKVTIKVKRVSDGLVSFVDETRLSAFDLAEATPPQQVPGGDELLRAHTTALQATVEAASVEVPGNENLDPEPKLEDKVTAEPELKKPAKKGKKKAE